LIHRTLFFGQTLNFSGRRQQQKMKNVFIKRKNGKFIPSIEMKCPKSGIFTNNFWVG